jgi:hypothetical protein
MRQVMREQAYCCGVVAGFLKSYAGCVAQTAQQNRLQYHDDDYEWRSHSECLYRPDWAADGEGAELFTAGMQEGLVKGKQAFETGDLALIESLGHIAGWTTKRPPRNYRWVYAERDAANGRLTGEAWRRFVISWRQTGGDRRRIKEV